MTISIMLALISLWQRRSHERNEKRMAALRRARRVRVVHSWSADTAVDGGCRVMVDGCLEYEVTHHGEDPIHELEVAVKDQAFHPPYFQPLIDQSHSGDLVSPNGGSVKGRIELPNVKVAEDELSDLSIFVTFYDIDGYKWQYDSLWGTIAEKPLHDPHRRGQLWWWFHRKKFMLQWRLREWRKRSTSGRHS
jgi:hypothetical protein